MDFKSTPVAEEIPRDSCGIIVIGETPQRDSARRLTRRPRKARGISGAGGVNSQSIDIVDKNTAKVFRWDESQSLEKQPSIRELSCMKKSKFLLFACKLSILFGAVVL